MVNNHDITNGCQVINHYSPLLTTTIINHDPEKTIPRHRGEAQIPGTTVHGCLSLAAARGNICFEAQWIVVVFARKMVGKWEDNGRSPPKN